MKFNVKNYEEYALEYLEGSLDQAEQKEYAVFLLLHPEIREELESFKLVTLAPNTAEVYAGKDGLHRNRGNGFYRVVAGMALIACLMFVYVWKSNDLPIENQMTSNIPVVAETKLERETTIKKESSAESTQISVNEPIIRESATTQEPSKLPDVEKDIKGDVVATFQEQPSAFIEVPATKAKVNDVERTFDKSTFAVPTKSERVLRPATFVPVINSLQQIPYEREMEKIEIIHPALIKAFSELQESNESQSKLGKWLTQVHLVPSAFEDKERSEVKNKFLPTYFTAE